MRNDTRAVARTTMIRELRDRHFTAEHDNTNDRHAAEAKGGVDPGPVYGRVDVKITAGSPTAWAATALREIAAALEQEGA